MSNRRSFFQSLARAAAIIALAPQIAFRVPAARLEDYWFIHHIEMEACASPAYGLYDFLVGTRAEADRITRHMAQYYANSKRVSDIPINVTSPEKLKELFA